MAKIPRQGLFDYEMVKMHKCALTNAAKIGILYIEQSISDDWFRRDRKWRRRGNAKTLRQKDRTMTKLCRVDFSTPKVQPGFPGISQVISAEAQQAVSGVAVPLFIFF